MLQICPINANSRVKQFHVRLGSVICDKFVAFQNDLYIVSTYETATLQS